jgi:hypothetical protein
VMAKITVLQQNLKNYKMKELPTSFPNLHSVLGQVTWCAWCSWCLYVKHLMGTYDSMNFIDDSSFQYRECMALFEEVESEYGAIIYRHLLILRCYEPRAMIYNYYKVYNYIIIIKLVTL